MLARNDAGDVTLSSPRLRALALCPAASFALSTSIGAQLDGGQ
jgi:hypothetical protein